MVQENSLIKSKVIVIGGPTASGKTGVAIELAKKVNGEIINCDSMQIYKYMNIGTGKPTEQEMNGVKHHLMSFLEPTDNYSVAAYKKDAMSAIEEILSRGKTPIVVGGTGLYLDALLYNISYPSSSEDGEDSTAKALRNELRNECETRGCEYIYNRLVLLDPEAAIRISPNDSKRIIRALEVILSTGESIIAHEMRSKETESPYKFIIFVLSMDREHLYDRINKRVDIMIERGLPEEAEKVYNMCLGEDRTAIKAIAYKEMFDYLNGEKSLTEASDYLKQKTRNYAKRQITWFKKYTTDAVTIDMTDKDSSVAVEEIVACLNK